MKCKLILAALAMLLTGSAASAFTSEQLRTLEITQIARWGGYDNHCPRFTVIELAVYDELLQAGFTDAELESDSESKFQSASVDAVVLAMRNYKANPSSFCNAAWHMLGPNGTYKRQMLEAK
jgi:hypothetical protein